MLFTTILRSTELKISLSDKFSRYTVPLNVWYLLQKLVWRSCVAEALWVETGAPGWSFEETDGSLYKKKLSHHQKSAKEDSKVPEKFM